MKKLIMIILLIITFSTSYSAIRLNTIIGMHTVHVNDIDNKGQLNNDNKLLSLELQYKKFTINGSIFDNSFYIPSWAAGFRYYFGDGNLKMISGIMLIKGYTKEQVFDFLYLQDDYSYAPILGYSLKVSNNTEVELILLGAALNTAIKFNVF